MTLESSVTEIKGVGDEVAKKLDALGIRTIFDLIDYLPRRYNDYSDLQPIAKIHPGIVSIEAEIKQSKGRYVRRGMHITEAVASDPSGSVRLVWFNQPYRAASLKSGEKYFISGDFQLSRQHLSILNPSVEQVSDFPVNTARIIPIYRETKGITSTQIRRFVREVVPLVRDLPEILPEWLVYEEKLMSRAEAYEALHFPASSKELERARHRFGFQEVFELTLAALLNKHELLLDTALSIPFDEQLAKEFVKHLPFTLTDAQRKAVWRIYQDLAKTTPMNRLLEGDVGAGKTVVAAMAALMAMKQGFQVAFMAPTELLARQHADTVFELFEPLGLASEVSLLIGGLTVAQKKRAHQDIAAGRIRCIIGTHALIQEKVDMHKLGLVIIDEQHRFGVEQRKKLSKKAGHAPHTLTMTATPIPRSLALTLYGELDISIIDAKPKNRLPIETSIVPPSSRDKLYKSVDKELDNGRQMFVVCPLIEESEALPVASAQETYEKLRKGPFKHRRVGLLHGRMKSEEKDAIMRQFVQCELDILVSTTVIEVGVDVPNATVMIVEAAERFGLAQLHQLRGRVGRSQHQGYCYLMMTDAKQPTRRLKALERSQNGFKLAELDLELRGPGAIYGHAQHGELDLRVARLTDTELIARARARAQECIDRGDDLLQYKELYAHVNSLRAVTNLN